MLDGFLMLFFDKLVILLSVVSFILNFTFYMLEYCFKIYKLLGEIKKYLI